MEAYQKTYFEDSPSTTTPITAEELNKIGDGIETVTEGAIDLEEEIAAARGTYQNLNERLAHTSAPTDEQVEQAIDDYFDGKSLLKYVEVTGTSRSAVNNCTDPDTVYKVYVASGVVTTGAMNVICTPTIGVYKAQYAWSKDGYIIVRTYDGSTWGAWDFVPHSSRVATMISTAIANLVSNSRTIAGIDLQDDITAAELKSALNVPNPTNYYTKDEIDSTFVDLNTFNSELDDIDSEISAKADKSDTYTKAEVDAVIQTAIGGVENGSY